MYKTVVTSAFLLSITVITATQEPLSKGQLPVTEATPKSVVLTVTVRNNKGELVSGLKQDHFGVFVDKAPAKIHYFGDQDVPVSIGILFDVSSSIEGRHAPNRLKVLKDGLSSFLKLGNKSNEYFIGGFNNKAQLLLDWTSDPSAAADPLSTLRAKANTALYDAVVIGLEKVLQGRHRKRVILLISDGMDNNSRYKFSEVQRLLKESNVLVYSICACYEEQGSNLGLEGQAVLDELSTASGGIALKPNSKAAINIAFERIAEELRYQYTIGLAPKTSEGKKKSHDIKVTVTSPSDALRKMKLSARTRKGYYGTTLN